MRGQLIDSKKNEIRTVDNQNLGITSYNAINLHLSEWHQNFYSCTVSQIHLSSPS